MHRPDTRRVGVVAAVLLLAALPLSAIPLDDLLKQAEQNSSSMKNLEITRSNVLLQQAATKIDDGVKVSVNSGELKYTNPIDTKNNWNVSRQRISLSGSSVEITLPNDGKTAFSFSVDPFSYSQAGSSWNYLEDPSLSVSHTITYGKTQDLLKDLNIRQTEMMAHLSYESAKLTFANTLYSQIGALVDNEKSIKSTTQKLTDAKKELSDKLVLGQVKKGSLVYQAQDQAIRLTEGTLESLQASRDLLVRQFETIMGVPYPDAITDIREPDLSFAMNAEGSTSVASKRIEVQKAKETLALRIAQYTNRTLVAGGNISYANSQINTNLGPMTQNSLTLGGSAALAGKSFTVQGAVGGTYDFDKGTLTPVVAISGTWSNDPAFAKDTLEIRQLENEVLLAEIAYNNAVDEYIQSSIEVQNGIASWQLEYALLLQTIRYNKDLLKQQRELFENGLVTKKQVEDAAFTVELDEYDLKAMLLKGLQLENEIKRLMM